MKKGSITRQNQTEKEEFIKSVFINESFILSATPSSLLIYNMSKAMFMLTDPVFDELMADDVGATDVSD